MRRLDRAIGGACYGFQPHPLRGSLSCQSEKGRAPFLPKPLGSAGEWHSNRQAAPHPHILFAPWHASAAFIPMTVSTSSSCPDRNAAASSSPTWTPRPAVASAAAQLRPHPSSVSAPAVAPRVPSAWSLAWPHLPPFRTAFTPATSHCADSCRGAEFRQKDKPRRRRGLRHYSPHGDMFGA